MSLFSRLTEKSWQTPGVDPTRDPALYRPEGARVGLFVYLAVATMLFGLITMAYVMRMGDHGMSHGPTSDWRSMPEPPLIWINTAVLLANSAAWEWARTMARRERTPALLMAIFAPGLIALLFLAGQLALWSEYAAGGYYASTNPANAFFYLISGLHGLHLLGGLFFWGGTLSRLLAGAEAAEVRLPVDLCAAYWHFLLLIWIVMLGLLIST